MSKDNIVQLGVPINYMLSMMKDIEKELNLNNIQSLTVTAVTKDNRIYSNTTLEGADVNIYLHSGVLGQEHLKFKDFITAVEYEMEEEEYEPEK